MNPFDYSLDYRALDLRANPELYRVGKGEQGVLLVRPYKDEILPHWKFRTPAVARESSEKIFALYEDYKRAGDFVGMDMARKFLQMGYTRARRYANHVGGKKYDGPVPADQKGRSGAHGRAELPRNAQPDPDKVEAAAIFKAKWDAVKADPDYTRMMRDFKARSADAPGP